MASESADTDRAVKSGEFPDLRAAQCSHARSATSAALLGKAKL